jgi:small subunit ribosomal protein S18
MGPAPLTFPPAEIPSNISMSNVIDKNPKKSLTPSEVPFTSPEILARYVTDTGKILPRRITGLSAKDQRAITKQIKRARNMLLMQ